jgi:regulator of protease activity HflC (stomatin/prohibitin superfamily)
MFAQKFTVRPGEVGFLYHKQVLQRQLGPGEYSFRSWGKTYMLVLLSLGNEQIYATNQEILTKDRIALRFSCYGLWRITAPARAMEHLNVAELQKSKEQLRYMVQVEAQMLFRDRISGGEAEALVDDRAAITEGLLEALNTRVEKYGITASSLQLIDLTFPKTIQDIFAKRLEAKVRAQVELENARSQVAATRALKNAAELMKADPEIRYLQYLELLSSISSKGKHTFVLSQEPPKLG